MIVARKSFIAEIASGTLGGDSAGLRCTTLDGVVYDTHTAVGGVGSMTQTDQQERIEDRDSMPSARLFDYDDTWIGVSFDYNQDVVDWLKSHIHPGSRRWWIPDERVWLIEYSRTHEVESYLEFMGYEISREYEELRRKEQEQQRRDEEERQEREEQAQRKRRWEKNYQDRLSDEQREREAKQPTLPAPTISGTIATLFNLTPVNLRPKLYQHLALVYHPDTGGDVKWMTNLNLIWEQRTSKD